MMLPILISVSVAPVSYFFWASAAPEVTVKAMTAVENAAIRSCCPESIVSPWFKSVQALLEFADQPVGDDGDLPCAMRHQEDDEEQQHAEHGAGQTLGDAFRDVRHED